jgi:hypothetical protein
MSSNSTDLLQQRPDSTATSHINTRLLYCCTPICSATPPVFSWHGFSMHRRLVLLLLLLLLQRTHSLEAVCHNNMCYGSKQACMLHYLSAVEQQSGHGGYV